MRMPGFNQANELSFVDIPEIFTIYKNSISRKIIITAEQGEFYIPSTIDQINSIMTDYGFMQIDRNRIINLAQVKRVVGSNVYIDGTHYHVTKENKKLIEDLIENTSRDTKS